MFRSYDDWLTTPSAEYDECEEEGEVEPAPYVLAPKGTTPNGCSRRRWLPMSLTRDVMVGKFGKPDTDAYWEPERGYDGDEWIFVLGQGDADVRFTVYSRWGAFRVGANVVDDSDVDDFIAWLEEAINMVLRSS